MNGLRSVVVGACVLGVLGGAWGCGGAGEKHTVVTAEFSGRRVQEFAVDWPWCVYEWVPTAESSADAVGQLVLRDLRRDTEQVLEREWSGGAMAVSDGRAVWWSRREADGTGVAPFRMRKAGDAKSQVVGRGRARTLDVSGPFLVWEERTRERSVIFLRNIATGEQRKLATGTREDNRRHFFPRVDGGRAVWTSFVPARDEYELTTYDIAHDFGRPTPVVHPTPFRCELAGDAVVYRLGTGEAGDVLWYDLEQNAARTIRSGVHLRGPLAFDGRVVAWLEQVAREDFREVPGHPLLSPSDFNHVYRYSVATGETVLLGENLLSVPPRIEVARGHVYSTVYRDLPAPEARQTAVPIDLLRW